MGCDYYEVALGITLAGGNAGWGKVSIHFSDMDEDYSCLCTFPHNYTVDGVIKLDKTEVRSMAVLGAMVALAYAGRIQHQQGYSYIPNDVPEDVRKEIDRVVGYRPE